MKLFTPTDGTCFSKWREGSSGQGESFTCGPTNVRVLEFAIPKKGTLEGFLLVLWQPCQFGRDAVEGYQVPVCSDIGFKVILIV